MGRKLNLRPIFCTMNQPIEDFLARLAQASLDGPVFNQYAADGTEANAVRRENLRLYLEQMAVARPSLLLVGEAPGYRGCRLTGIPFTSESIILDEQIRPFGSKAGYRKTDEKATVTKEASATMVWAALAGAWPPPLLWNAFPFHPHQPDRPASNRRPVRHELQLGAGFLVEIMALFPATAVVAVGCAAATALSLAGQGDYPILRHPSHGGKAAFQAGLAHIMANPPDPYR